MEFCWILFVVLTFDPLIDNVISFKLIDDNLVLLIIINYQ